MEVDAVEHTGVDAVNKRWQRNENTHDEKSKGGGKSKRKEKSWNYVIRPGKIPGWYQKCRGPR